MLVYNGRKAHLHYQARRDGTTMWVQLPADASADRVLVVRQYRHLGGLIVANGSLVPETARRTKASDAALKAIGVHILRSKEVPAPTKLQAVQSFVWSRLLYNVHTWTRLAGRQLRALESAFMRAIRRATGTGWGSTTRLPPSDAVLQAIRHPSLECMVRQRRLLLLGRLLRDGPPSLRALLATQPRGLPQPWVTLLIDDLRVFKLHVPAVAALPDPAAQVGPWLALARDWPGPWKLLVCRLITYDSSQGSPTPTPAGERLHSCTECFAQGLTANFCSLKALRQHCRVKHGYRCLAKDFVEQDGVCPACRRRFASRLRAVAHITDHRRGKACLASIVAGNHPRLSSARIAALDELDRAARRAARAEGHTNPLVPGSTR